MALTKASAGVIKTEELVGFRNRYINGNFDIWQRSNNTTFTTDTSGYVADRWFNGIFGAGTMVVSKQENSLTSDIQSRYFHRVVITGTANASSVTGYTEQKVEDVRQFHNQPVTISFWAKAATATTYQIRQHWNFGSGGSSEIYSALQDVSITTSWKKYSITFSPTDLSAYTIGTQNTTFYGIMFYWTTSQGSARKNDNTFDIAELQLEVGSGSSTYERRPYAMEMQLCQRYCYAAKPLANGTIIGVGQAYSSTVAIIGIAIPSPMRATPTLTRNGLSVWPSNAASDISVSNLIVSDGSPSFVRVDATVASGLTAGQAAFLQGTSSPSNSGYLILSAEL